MYKSLLLSALVAVGFAAAQNNAGQSFIFNGERVTCDENNVCCDGQGGCIPLSEEEVQLGINSPGGIQLLADGAGIQPAGTPFAEETGNNNGGENNQNNGGENNQNNGGENNEGPQNNAGQSFNFNGQRVTCDENNVCCDGQGGCIPLSEEEVQLGINNPNGIRLLADGRGIQPA